MYFEYIFKKHLELKNEFNNTNESVIAINNLIQQYSIECRM